jgi:hypothetical protein
MKNPWKRKGLFYYARFNLFTGRSHRFVGTMDTRLFFVSYWAIKWYHGDRELFRMGMGASFKERYKDV